MRAVYTVSVLRYVPGATDAHGNPAPTYAPAVDQSVYAVGPKHNVENNDGTRDSTVTLREVYAPPGFSVDPLDLLEIDGETWEVFGNVLDYTKGPFSYHPGVVVTVRLQEG